MKSYWILEDSGHLLAVIGEEYQEVASSLASSVFKSSVFPLNFHHPFQSFCSDP